jgi:exodeoxyribonuclease-3
LPLHVHDRYSWWSYRAGARDRNVGWRIDYFFVSEDLQDKIIDAEIMDHIMGSDHCPVKLVLEF